MKRWQKTVLTIHTIGLFLCVVLLFALPEKDHLRWNMGYAIVWITTLSALAFVFIKSKKKWINRTLKFYWAIGLSMLLLPIPLTEGLWLIVLREVYWPHTKYSETEVYIMRDVFTGLFGFPSVALWKKEGIREKHIKDYPPFWTVEKFEVKNDIGAIIIYGTSFNEGITDDSNKYVEICPLNDSLFKANRHQVEKLKQELEMEASNETGQREE